MSSTHSTLSPFHQSPKKLSWADTGKLFVTDLLKPLSELWESGAVRRTVSHLTSKQGIQTIAKTAAQHPVDTLILTQPMYGSLLPNEISAYLVTALNCSQYCHFIRNHWKEIKEALDSGSKGTWVIILLSLGSLPDMTAATSRSSYRSMVEVVTDPHLNHACDSSFTMQDIKQIVDQVKGGTPHPVSFSHTFARHTCADGYCPVSVTGPYSEAQACTLVAPTIDSPPVEICFDRSADGILPETVTHQQYAQPVGAFADMKDLKPGTMSVILEIQGCHFPLPPAPIMEEHLDTIAVVPYKGPIQGTMVFSAATRDPNIRDAIFIPKSTTSSTTKLESIRLEQQRPIAQ